MTFEALRRGADMSFREAMTQELDISLNFLKTQDFYEGIRAQLAVPLMQDDLAIGVLALNRREPEILPKDPNGRTLARERGDAVASLGLPVRARAAHTTTAVPAAGSRIASLPVPAPSGAG